MRRPRYGESIRVFYLVAWIGERKLNPVELTRRFAESYLRCPAGIDHRLTLIFKGFQNQGQIAEHSSLFNGIAPSVIEVPDVEQDIGLYRAALDTSDWDLCCVFNSYSIILAPGWLASFSRCGRDPRVGIVGARGGFESHFSHRLAALKASLAPQKLGLQTLRHFAAAARLWAYFPAFPNVGIGTNAFMIRRDVFERVKWPRNPSRMGAWRFESGRRSLTHQVMGMGLNPVIIGRDGRGYGVSEWPASGTFGLKEQENLLVGDNHSIDYSTSSPERRRQLAALNWGNHAAE